MYYDHSAVGIGFHEATSLALFGPGEMSPRQTTQRPEHCSQGFPLRQMLQMVPVGVRVTSIDPGRCPHRRGRRASASRVFREGLDGDVASDVVVRTEEATAADGARGARFEAGEA